MWSLDFVDAGCCGRWSLWTLVAVGAGRRERWSLRTLVAVSAGRCERWSLWTLVAVNAGCCAASTLAATNDKHAYAGELYTLTHLKALLVLHDRGIRVVCIVWCAHASWLGGLRGNRCPPSGPLSMCTADPLLTPF
jgi:hypothetical protein